MMRLFVVATLLCCSCLSIVAQEVEYGKIESPIVVHSFNLHDLLLSGRTVPDASKARMRTGTGDAIVNYIDRISNMPDYLHDFYDQYVDAAHTVLDGGSSWLSDYMIDDKKVESANGFHYYLLKEVIGSTGFTFPANSTKEIIGRAAENVAVAYINPVIDSLASFFPHTFLSVNFDCPEAFWIGNNFQYCYLTSYDYSYIPPKGTGTVTYTIKLGFVLHDDSSGFDIRSYGASKHNFRSVANITEGVESFNSAVQTILEQCKSNSRLRMLRRVHDWLTMHNCYNDYCRTRNWKEDILGGMPWSPLSALEGNANNMESPVCEGYARAMKVLCDAMDIPCILMSGMAAAYPFDTPTQHMWNYVQMEDGKWYAIDATWDDPIVEGTNKAISGSETHKWFMLGSEEPLKFGLWEWPFIDSHPEMWSNGYGSNGSIGWEFRDGPVLSTMSWVSPDPYDPNGDGTTDHEDIQLMAEKIVNDDDDIEDVDGNDFITIGDLVLIINRCLSK